MYLCQEHLSLLLVVYFFLVRLFGHRSLDVQLTSLQNVSLLLENILSDSRVFVPNEGEASKFVWS